MDGLYAKGMGGLCAKGTDGLCALCTDGRGAHSAVPIASRLGSLGFFWLGIVVRQGEGEGSGAQHLETGKVGRTHPTRPWQDGGLREQRRRMGNQSLEGGDGEEFEAEVRVDEPQVRVPSSGSSRALDDEAHRRVPDGELAASPLAEATVA